MKKQYYYNKSETYYTTILNSNDNNKNKFIMGLQIASLKGKELNAMKKYFLINNLFPHFIRKFQLKALISSSENDLANLFTNSMLLIKGEDPYKQIPEFINYCQQNKIDKKSIIVVIYVNIEAGFRKFNLVEFLKQSETNKSVTQEEALVKVTQQLQRTVIKANIKLIDILKRCQPLIK